MRRFWKDERGAAELIEATLLYPIIFICIGLLLYFGLFILQTISVQNYARKTALLAAREIAYPGYINMITDEALTSASAELQLNDYTKSITDESNKILTGEKKDKKEFVIHLSIDPKDTQVRAYRYWLPNPLDDSSAGAYEDALVKMIQNNSILGGKDKAEVKITGKNYFVTQYVEVDVTQPIFEFPLLRAIHMEAPSIRAHAVASVNDTDEFIRNTDLACDALEMLAKKLHIDIDSMRKKLDDILEKLGLN